MALSFALQWGNNTLTALYPSHWIKASRGIYHQPTLTCVVDHLLYLTLPYASLKDQIQSLREVYYGPTLRDRTEPVLTKLKVEALIGDKIYISWKAADDLSGKKEKLKTQKKIIKRKRKEDSYVL